MYSILNLPATRAKVIRLSPTASSCPKTFSSTHSPPTQRIPMYRRRRRLRVCTPPLVRRLYSAYILADLHEVVRGAQTGMLTSRASNGCLHARAMAPVGRELQFFISLGDISMTKIAQRTPRVKSTLFSSQTTPLQSSRNSRTMITSMSASSINRPQTGQVSLGLPRLLKIGLSSKGTGTHGMHSDVDISKFKLD